jgi:hypothetical protein
MLFISCAKKMNYKPLSLKLTGHGSDMKSIECKFNPSKETIESFFNLASEISSKEEHQVYGWSPCFVEGYIEWKNSKWKFKLRPTGSANLLDDQNNLKLLGNLSFTDSWKKFLK